MNGLRIFLAVMFVGMILLIALWDIACAAWGRPDDTVSATLQDWGRQHTMLTVAIGSVVGHLFWPTRWK